MHFFIQAQPLAAPNLTPGAVLSVLSDLTLLVLLQIIVRDYLNDEMDAENIFTALL